MNNNLKMAFKRYAPFPGALAAAYRTARSIALAPSRRRVGRLLTSRLEGLQKDQPRVWFFGVPTHNNLGDLAQWICIRDWLGVNFPSHEIVEVTSDEFHGATAGICAQLERLVDAEGDLVVMQSGYTMDGLHPDERAHALVPSILPSVRTIFFPQTILYRSRTGLRRMQTTLRSSPRLLLLARDPHSMELAQEYFPNTKICLFPDIVTSLIGKFGATTGRSGILLCARNDGEKHYSSGDLGVLSQELGALGPVTTTDTSIDLALNQFTPDLVRKKVEEEIRYYSQFRAVVTDRYHGTIFAVAAGTPVVVLRTTDHKVTSGADWLAKYYPHDVHAAENLQDAVAAARGMLMRDQFPAPASWADDHYLLRLKALIESM